MALEKIRRPPNVHVPRSVERRIQARRALEDGTVEVMRSTLKELGEDSPSRATKADLQQRPQEVAGGGMLIGRSAATAPAAAAPAPGGEA
jgi:hypothetical protein